MPSQIKKSNFQLFVDCWNIYSGIIYESTNKISRRTEATQAYAEMCMMLGAKRLEIAPGITVEPDYFPIRGSDGEFDFILGFSLNFHEYPLGQIHSISCHNGKLIIATESMTIGFRVDIWGEDYEIN